MIRDIRVVRQQSSLSTTYFEEAASANSSLLLCFSILLDKKGDTQGAGEAGPQRTSRQEVNVPSLGSPSAAHLLVFFWACVLLRRWSDAKIAAC
jgi:hypothetical protein